MIDGGWTTVATKDEIQAGEKNEIKMTNDKTGVTDSYLQGTANAATNILKN